MAEARDDMPLPRKPGKRVVIKARKPLKPEEEVELRLATKKLTIEEEGDEYTFFFIDHPWSEDADPVQLEDGDFIKRHSQLAANMTEKLDQFQGFVGNAASDPKIEITYFKNWANTVDGLLYYAKPKTTEEVQQLVRAARDMNNDDGVDWKIVVGCAGAYHSWSPLFPDSGGLLLNMTEVKLDDVGTTIRLNPGKQSVTISPGVTGTDLMEFFLDPDNDVCMESDALIATLTYGGVLMTGCHGVGRDQPSMSDWITSLKLVDAEGNVKEYPKDAEGIPDVTEDEVMNTLRVPLGVCGAVVEMTVQVSPMSNVTVENIFHLSVGEVFYGPNPRIKQLVEEDYWSIEIFWFPFNSMSLLDLIALRMDRWNPAQDKLWIRAINKTDQTAFFGKWTMALRSLLDVTQGMLAQLWPQLSTFLSQIPVVNPDVLKPLFPFIGFEILKLTTPSQALVQKLPYAIHYRDAVDISVVQDMEFALPVNDDYQSIKDAVKVVADRVKEAAEANRYPMNVALEMRFIGKSNCYLCPAYTGNNSDINRTVYIETVSLENTEGYKAFYRQVAADWMQIPGSIPHLAKQWSFIDGIYEHIHANFGTNISTFRSVRNKLGIDPNDMFMNSTLTRLLYPVPT